MKTGLKFAAVLAGCAVVTAAAVGCSSGGYPLSIEITMTLGEGYHVQDYGLTDPGDPIAPEMPIPAVPMCTLPDRADLDEMIRQAVGGVVAGMIKLEKLELLEVNIIATSGDFNSLDWLSMYYQPKPVLGIGQPVVELGETYSETGLGTAVTLIPDEPVDFLQLIDEIAANPAEGCPKFGVRLNGVVPEVTPVWDVRVKVRVVGRVEI